MKGRDMKTEDFFKQYDPTKTAKENAKAMGLPFRPLITMEQHERWQKCNTKACGILLIKGFVRIHNNPSTVAGYRIYCPKCARGS